ncbi:GntR family transcriptional regulator [Microbacterium marinilacus]|uniref:GntR family transcriptional regulator n=1 Tax=Microbacterium marinilacus TaxID=415209 RepID=A0ABP7BG84_9MICO|nr:GntR family transcriptional regulator [Microbacterium marinilacus]MBY0690140.1 GntR family transcriptional regulator [Microbacterium marinilacus]
MTRYPEIADDLRRRVLQGELPAGARLPAEMALAADYGVSRGVIRNALAALQRRGLVTSHPGAGWQVSPAFQPQEFAELRSFAQWARSRRMTPGGRVVRQRRVPADAEDARRLRMPVGDDVLRVTRVRTLDGRPVMVERTTYAPWTIPAIEALPVDEPSVMAAMLAEGIATSYGSHRIDTVAASGEDAELLGVRRSMRLLRVRRETSARDGRPIEWGDDRYAPDTITFEVHATATRQMVGRAEA